MDRNQAIVLYQPILQQIAIKMVGSLADAEDIVQDTFLKWLTVNTEKIENTKAYLIRAVTNNCITHINTFKRKGDEYLCNLKSADLVDWYREKDFFKFDVENEVAAALNVINKRLEPLEKGVYILKELFDFEYEELQHIFDRRKDNCRQLFSRAKSKLSQESGKMKVEFSNSYSLENFKKACQLGSPDDIIKDVKQEINSKVKKSKKKILA